MPSAVILQALPLAAAIGAAFCHGERQTDAKWLTWATRLEKGVPRARKWAHRPRLQRRAIQAAAVFLAAETAAGALTAPGLTAGAWMLTALLLLAWTLAWAYLKARAHARVIGHVTLKDAARHAPAVARQWWHHRYGYTVRVRDSLVPVFGVTPWRVKLPPDLSAVRIRPPYTFAGRKDQLEAVQSTVSTLLPVEGLEPDWSKLHGFDPLIRFAQTEPPPRELYWDDRMAAICKRAKAHELVIGIGHKGQTVKVSLESDSPHLGIGMGTGAGKSNLAAFWLVQRLMRGDVVAVLDGRRTSHPWAYKNMAYEYDQLPNVAYARRIDDIHNLLCWLGAQRAERDEVAEDNMNARGHLRCSVGPRLFILAEELNLIVPMLKTYWEMRRAADPGLPKKNPALLALAAIAFAGRAVKMNIIFLGQRLDAEVFGCNPSQGGAVRGNVGVRCLARYDEPAWRLQAGGVPMPPSPSVTGRIQAWIGGQVSECQVPFMDHKDDRSILRELAVSGDVTGCPPGMPGSRSVSVLDKRALPMGPEQGNVVIGQLSPRPANLVTLREAHDAGLFGARRLDAVQRASNRHGFPAPVRKEGRAHLYDFDDLAAMQAGKELVR